jgi:hypothetical protein
MKFEDEQPFYESATSQYNPFEQSAEFVQTDFAV